MNKEYLGDGVYVEYLPEECSIVLSTERAYIGRVEIFLGNYELNELLAYIERLKAQLKDEQNKA